MDQGEAPASHRHIDSSNRSWRSAVQDRTPTDFYPAEGEGDQDSARPDSWPCTQISNLTEIRPLRRIFRGTQRAGRAAFAQASIWEIPVGESVCLRFKSFAGLPHQNPGNPSSGLPVLRWAQVSRQSAAVQRACGPAEICPEEARIGRSGRWAENLTPGLRCCSPPDRRQFRDRVPDSATYRARSARRPAAGCYLHEISDD
jgi:hypothetical protein